MILDAFERIFPVADTHDFIFIGPGDHVEAVGERAGLDDEGMVAGGLEGVG